MVIAAEEESILTRPDNGVSTVLIPTVRESCYKVTSGNRSFLGSLSTFMPHNKHNARAPTVCKELWFHDGNIIIQAGNLVFKVFRSILSRESTVFNEMIFALPPSASPSQEDAVASFDGLPLVFLTDTEDEIRLFLSVIYDAK